MTWPSETKAAPTDSGRHGEAGFTLLELVVAMAVFSLVSLGIYGVLVLGARSAGSGERITEQARRYRVANEVLSRQIASAQPMCLPEPDDGFGIDDDDMGSAIQADDNDDEDEDDEDDEDEDDEDEDEDEEDSDGARDSKPFFFGHVDTLEFVTTAPQRPDASGMAIVNYWVEDGTLRMSERPAFSAYSSTKDLDHAETDDTVSTILLYDVESVTFSYQRESDEDEWLEEWDGRDEDLLPACVRIDVKPSAVGGPDFYHEVPVIVGAFNQIGGDVDDEFNCE